MVDDLAASAEKLAKTERQQAWQEMARQVAHEIKNPLDPHAADHSEFPTPIRPQWSRQ